MLSKLEAVCDVEMYRQGDLPHEELVARVAGKQLVVDAGLEREIEGISRMIAERLRRPYTDFTTGVRKQATLPDGGISLGLAGTAPGIVLQADSCAVVILPGPPRELQRLWPRALETDPVRRVLERAPARERLALRFFGTPESAVAQALEEAGGEGDGVEATICAREFEIHVDLVLEPGAEERGAAVARSLREGLGKYLFSEDERSIAEIVLDLCRGRGLTLATAESCTGGLVGARITDVPGASSVYLGGIVSYSDRAKVARLGVAEHLLERYGAVSEPVVRAMAEGVRAAFEASIGVAVTGIAGMPLTTALAPFFAPFSGNGSEANVRWSADTSHTAASSRTEASVESPCIHRPSSSANASLPACPGICVERKAASGFIHTSRPRLTMSMWPPLPPGWAASMLPAQLPSTSRRRSMV